MKLPAVSKGQEQEQSNVRLASLTLVESSEEGYLSCVFCTSPQHVLRNNYQTLSAVCKEREHGESYVHLTSLTLALSPEVFCKSDI